MNQNPNHLWWDCEKHGCFNKKKRPPIGVFNPCFSRGINLGDVDAEVEAGKGRLLKLEFKDGRKIGDGQLRSYLSQTRVNHITIIQVDSVQTETKGALHADLMVRGFRFFQFGKVFIWQEGDLESLKKAIRAWYVWADNSPTLPDVVEPEFENKSPVHKRYREAFEGVRGKLEGV